MEENVIKENIKINIRNQFMFEYLKTFSFFELDKLINQIIIDNQLTSEDLLNLEDIRSFLLLENHIGKDISNTIRSYFIDCEFDDMEYNNFIEGLSYKDLLLMESVLNVYSRSELQKTNENRISNILQSIIKECRKNDNLVRNRRKEYNEVR